MNVICLLAHLSIILRVSFLCLLSKHIGLNFVDSWFPLLSFMHFVIMLSVYNGRVAIKCIEDGHHSHQV
jgi:hypothetical protein